MKSLGLLKNFKNYIDTQRIYFSCEPCTKYVGKPFTRHSIWPLASLGTKSHGARERFTSLYLNHRLSGAKYKQKNGRKSKS